MNASKKREFHYHAGASPLGGHVTHPIEKILNTEASTSLAQAGGHVESRIGPYRFDDTVLVNHAYSHVSGVKNKTTKSWTTLVTSVVEQLNVLEVVTADRIVSRLAVEHPAEGYNPTVTVVGSAFVNLRVAGVKIDPVLDSDLLTIPVGKNGFPEKPHLEDETFIKSAVDQSGRITKAKGALEWLKGRHDWVKFPEERKKRGHVLCSLVNELQGAKPGTAHGHVMHVPGFGNIFFGELTVAHGAYRLSMMRIEMGCIMEGNLSFATADSNGFPVP